MLHDARMRVLLQYLAHANVHGRGFEHLYLNSGLQDAAKPFLTYNSEDKLHL
jgi:hypothetical protein